MSEASNRILVAGSTGYLGGHLVRELLKKEAPFKALARSKSKLLGMGVKELQIIEARATVPEDLKGCCDEVDVVISCLGITRQKDGLKYEDVDFQANLNLLREAENTGVEKFIYVSAFNAPKYRDVRLLKAKEDFAEVLLASKKLKPYVVRPNGFFIDIKEFYAMAKTGRVYLFGKGDVRLNPIHGEDLARYCLEIMNKDGREYDIGGPDILSGNEIAQLAFDVLNRPEKISHLPDWIRRLSLFFARHLPEKLTGPAEFFLTAMGQDMIAPIYGEKSLGDYFKELSLRGE